MTAHRTAGQLRAMRELCALARVGLDVADVIAARGEESDDRPRAWLLSLERWCRGEETGPQLAARTRAMETWRAAVVAALPTGDPWADALHWLADARADMTRNPGHTEHTSRVCRSLADALLAHGSESPAAAHAIITRAVAAHRRAIGEEWAQAMTAARLRQAKADKVTAERALGTFPEKETT